MELYDEITEENIIYQIKNKENVKKSFYVLFESGEMYKIVEENSSELDVHNNILVKFISKINIFPLFIHIVSWSKTINITAESESHSKKISPNLYHHMIQVDNISAFYKFVCLAYLDSFNGELLVISSEKEIEVNYDDNNEFMYVLDFSDTRSSKCFLVFSYDGDGFNYLSNFDNHPYENFKFIKG